MFAGHDPTSTILVPHTRSSVSGARHAVALHMLAHAVPAPVVEDAVLVVSELVSNAVRHAAPLPGGSVSVRWTIGPDRVHLEITDGGAPTLPRAEDPTASAFGGRGLDIVRSLCTRWGVSEELDRMTVWADLPRRVSAPPRRPMQAAGHH
jgi:anti-sigma regulatory factor (Ser/Thr protein kinase)